MVSMSSMRSFQNILLNYMLRIFFEDLSMVPSVSFVDDFFSLSGDFNSGVGWYSRFSFISGSSNSRISSKSCVWKHILNQIGRNFKSQHKNISLRQLEEFALNASKEPTDVEWGWWWFARYFCFCSQKKLFCARSSVGSCSEDFCRVSLTL